MDTFTIVRELQKEATKYYIPNVEKEYEKKILIITPSLKLQGALTVLLELLEYYAMQDVQLFIISPEDGPYGQEFLKRGVPVVIREYVKCSNEYRKLLQMQFDLVFVNSAACYYYIYFFNNTNTKVFWWLHETETQLKTMLTNFPHLMLLSDNIHVAGVTLAVQTGIYQLFQKNIEVLPMPIKDCYAGRKEITRDKVVFFIPAAYTYIKGQDLLLKAILLLPREIFEKCEFVFCGYQLEGQEDYYDSIKSISSKISNVTFLEQLTKQDVFNWYELCDCVIAPSRVDATPTTIVEAMMFEKLCIVSDATGISKYLSDCDNGFVYPFENTEELAKRIMLVVLNRDELEPVSKAARDIYMDTFQPKVVFAKYRKLVE